MSDEKTPTERIVKLSQIRVGQAKPIGRKGFLSAIQKDEVSHAVAVNRSGLDGDQQADLKHHGGKEKAIHHYPAEHYSYWQSQLADKVEQIGVGAFGENFSSIGLTEHNVHIGDIYKVGTALLQVSQGRQPCWKLNAFWQLDDMAVRMQKSLRTGWYYRVLETGKVKAGDNITLIARPEPDWPLIRLLQTLFEKTLDYQSLSEMVNIESLADSWKLLAHKRLTRKQVESWQRRLNIPE